MRYQSRGRNTPISNKDKLFSYSNASPNSNSGSPNPFTSNSKQLNASKQYNKSKEYVSGEYGKLENKLEYRTKNEYIKTEIPYNKYTSQTTKNTQGQAQSNGRYFNNFFRDRQDKKPLTPTLSGHSQSKGYRKERSPKQNDKSAQIYSIQSGIKQNQFSKDLRQKHPQYQKLHDKLNFLEVRIAEMKNNMQKKRQEKRKFIDNQIKDRQRRQQQRKKRLEKLESSQHSQGPPSNIQTLQRKEQGNDAMTQSVNKNSPKNYNSLNSFVTQVPQHKQLKTFNFNPYSPRHNMYYVSEIVRAYKEDRSLARQHIQSSIHILKVLQQSKMATKQELSSRCMRLQRRKGYEDKKTVVFDLDQTLIHCNESTSVPYDVKLPIKFPTGEIIEAGINIRPYTTELLKNLSKNFEVIVFTASHSCYANVVLNYIDPDNKYIHHRLFRQHCYGTPQGMYVKDLRVIDRPASDMVLVDNAAYSYAFQMENGIPIIPYYEGKNDFELKALQDYLQGHILLAKDVRQVNRKTFKINRYREYDDIQKLVRELYGEWIR